MKRIVFFTVFMTLAIIAGAQRITELPVVSSIADGSLVIVRSGTSGNVLSQVSVLNLFKDRNMTVATTLNPDANDGATLGQSGTAFSDLFLASGAVIDFDAGDFTIAHTNSQYVTVTGDLGIAGRLDLSNGGTIETTGGNIDNTELYSLNGVTGGEVMTTESLTDAVLISVSDTTVTAVVGKIVFKTSDGHFYGCVATSGAKWKQLDN